MHIHVILSYKLKGDTLCNRERSQRPTSLSYCKKSFMNVMYMSNKVIFLGIAGPSASGKTLFAKTLALKMPETQLAIISEDAYYKEQNHLPFNERAQINYDHPNAIDTDLMLDHIHHLQNGHSICLPIYDYEQHRRSDKTRIIHAAPIILFEGILLFTHPVIRNIFNLKLYMDTPLDICLVRRLQRDLAKRGRDITSILNQYTSTVRPMFIQFIQPSRQYADLIIPHGGNNLIALDLIKTKIQAMLTE